MARREIIELIDDMDGTLAEETVLFGLDGQMFEIDLSSKNAAQLRAVLEDFISSARKVRGNVVPIKGAYNKVNLRPKRSMDREQSMAIRNWCDKHVPGSVSMRGRLAQPYIDAFNAQNPAMIPGYRAPAVKTNVTEVKFTDKSTAPTKAAKATTRKAAPKAATG